FFFQAEDGIRDFHVTGVQTCALPISLQRLAAINYAALRPMVAEVKQSGSKVIKVGQQLRFAVTVLEMAPYTTEVRIEQQALLKRSEERRVGKECRYRRAPND